MNSLPFSFPESKHPKFDSRPPLSPQASVGRLLQEFLAHQQKTSLENLGHHLQTQNDLFAKAGLSTAPGLLTPASARNAAKTIHEANDIYAEGFATKSSNQRFSARGPRTFPSSNYRFNSQFLNQIFPILGINVLMPNRPLEKSCRERRQTFSRKIRMTTLLSPQTISKLALRVRRAIDPTLPKNFLNPSKSPILRSQFDQKISLPNYLSRFNMFSNPKMTIAQESISSPSMTPSFNPFASQFPVGQSAPSINFPSKTYPKLLRNSSLTRGLPPVQDASYPNIK